MPQDEPIEFETVKQRFDEATSALQLLHSTLRSLQGADERQQQAATTVGGSVRTPAADVHNPERKLRVAAVRARADT